MDAALGVDQGHLVDVVEAFGRRHPRESGIAGKDALTDASYELYWIAVAGEHRAHGIGTILLDAVELEVSRIDPGAQLFIETAGREQYLPTRIFYQRHGYHQVAWISDYYAAGDAKVIYAKKLPGPCNQPPA